jgi:hypothetical protein
MSQTLQKRTVRFTLDDAQRAGDEWRFNCGPAALCAVLDMTPDEIRPHLLDFERKGYTNPTLMFDVLKNLGVNYRLTYRGDNLHPAPRITFGLMRVQWAGPWTRPCVPMRARYRETHWVAATGDAVFDVNAMCVGGWIPWEEWSFQLVPWLIRECCPKGDGNWWPTHVLEIEPRIIYRALPKSACLSAGTAEGAKRVAEQLQNLG